MFGFSSPDRINSAAVCTAPLATTTAPARTVSAPPLADLAETPTALPCRVRILSTVTPTTIRDPHAVASCSHVLGDCPATSGQPVVQSPHTLPASQPLILRGIDATCQPSLLRPLAMTSPCGGVGADSVVAPSFWQTASSARLYSASANWCAPSLAHSARTESDVRNAPV